MNNVIYVIVICVLTLILIAVISVFIYYYQQRLQCYFQPSPYCPANIVCPTSDPTNPDWMPCIALAASDGCSANCKDGEAGCFAPGISCADPFCVNCSLQNSGGCGITPTPSCSRYDTSAVPCPTGTTSCTTT